MKVCVFFCAGAFLCGLAEVSHRHYVNPGKFKFPDLEMQNPTIPRLKETVIMNKSDQSYD